MKVVSIVDKKGTAIDRLAQGVKRHLPHLDMAVCDLHPKRPDREQISRLKEELKDADILDCQYWKSGLLALETFTVEAPKMLAHYNPYNLTEQDWSEFDFISVCNKSMKDNLKEATLIPLTIDLDKFKFKRQMTKNKKVIMVANRIESKKGILPVAKVCKELGYKFVLIGSISDGRYFKEVMKEGDVEFKENIPDKELVKEYQTSAVHICNSVDGFESGTLCVLESMATGCPVLTRRVGHIPELDNGLNMVVREGQPEDEKDLKKELKSLMEDPKKREQIRQDGWQTAKTRGDVRRARQYDKIFWEVLHPHHDLVSVIIPTFNRKEALAKVIESIALQNWPAKEIIVCDDGSSDGTKEFIEVLRTRMSIPIKYVNTGTPDEYNLGYARNLGIIEAVGDIVVFLDDRYYAEPKMITNFVQNLHPKKWVYGSKGYKKGFVENVSCIYRQEIINAGMFNATIKKYGFQSQELRTRFSRQGFKFEFVPKAKAKIMFNTKNKYTRRDEIVESKETLWKLGMG